MKIILFTHPTFLGSQSMPRYANMIAQGMKQKGHEVKIWEPSPFFYKIPLKGFFKKWLGYIDQYIVFPVEVKLKLRHCKKETLFVFADQALGPWVSLVSNRSHVIHCHDFIALKSVFGSIQENPTGFTGKLYQNFIRKGFSKGKHFISISQKTQQDLHLLHDGIIETSVVCYNGLNRTFEPINVDMARSKLQTKLKLNLNNGYILHVGGNQFYKNRKGVIEIYEMWRFHNPNVKIPLLLIGSAPSDELTVVFNNSKFKNDIHFIVNFSDKLINEAYSGAICLLFPSLEEGFGWPIAEALASGCPVITTNTMPMTEVIGTANFFLIPRRPFEHSFVNEWALNASTKLSEILNLTENERKECLKIGFESVKRFDTNLSLNKIEEVYQSVLKNKNEIF